MNKAIVRILFVVSIIVLTTGFSSCERKPSRPAELSENSPPVSYPIEESVVLVPVQADISKLTELAVNEIGSLNKSDTIEVDANVSVAITDILYKEVKKQETKLVNKIRAEKRRAGEKCSKIFGKLFSKIVCEPVFEIVKVTVQVPETVIKIVKEPYEVINKSTVNTRARVKYDVALSALEFKLDGDKLIAAADFDYGLKLGVKNEYLKSIRATIDGIASCGMDGDPKRRVRVSISGNVGIKDDATLFFKKNSRKVDWVNACQLTAADIQLADILELPIIEKAVDKAIDKAIEKLPDEYDLKPKLAKIWGVMSKPIDVGNGLSITTNPNDIWLSPIIGKNGKIHTGLGFSAQPVLTVGEAVSRPISTLPPKYVVKELQPILNLIAEGRMTFTRANEEINSEIKAIDLGKFRDRIKIDSAEVYPGLNNTLVIGVQLSAPAKVKIYFSGNPVYDGGSGHIVMADLDYSIDSRNFLVKTADWVLHSNLRNKLQNVAKWNPDKETEKMIEDLKSFDKQLDIGRIVGGVDSLEPKNIWISRDYVHIVFGAKGNAEFIFAEAKPGVENDT